jgi:cytochrome c oxidase subunit 1
MAVGQEKSHGQASNEGRALASATGRGWFATPTHHELGVMYLIFASVAAIAALLLFVATRTELAAPGMQIFAGADSFDLFAGGFGMIMVFLVIMPAMLGGFGNLFVPPMIGAAETAFPRLNALAFWLLPASFVVLILSLIAGEDGAGVDLPLLSLLLAGSAFVLSAINFVSTILNMRAPGLSLHDMPLFAWSILVSNFLILLAVPVFGGTIAMLVADGPFRDGFLAPGADADPLLHQHLFWFFGHPEIYMLILPGFGMISQIVATFSKRAVVGGLTLAYVMVAIGFIGFVVWAHHLYAMGLAVDTTAYFVFATMALAPLVAVMIAAWVTTMWRGTLSLRAPMLWAIGFIFLLAVAGITAVMLASTGIDTLPEGRTYIVAHFHYVASLGAIFGIFAGWYYWFPKITGLLYNETLAKLHFWLSFAGVNLGFFPFPMLALAGLDASASGLMGGGDLVTVGSYFSAAGICVFLMCMAEARLRGRVAGDNPWGAGATTPEWTMPLPRLAHAE